MNTRQKLLTILCGLISIFLLMSCTSTPPTPTSIPTMSPPTETPEPTVTPTPESKDTVWLAHYMPWYQSHEYGGEWGWHWTMNHFSPSKVDENGHREIASHYYPLMGPYDSRDPDLLEYQVATMKLSGIDGVIVDWYGMEDYLDYGMLNDSTIKLFDVIKNAGMKFAICYEDQTIKHMVDQGHLDDGDVYTYAQEVMKYMQTNWFNDDAYMKIDGQPVLFNFGPQYFVNVADWYIIFEGLNPQPMFVTLDYKVAPAAVGGFPWPPMSLTQKGLLNEDTLVAYLSDFYERTADNKIVTASAFPGFRDIYYQAGVGSSYGYLNPRDGETFQTTLDLAVASNPDIIQLVTWNDYGEGTNIEPAEDYNYRYLEMVQDTRRNQNPDFPFGADDLPIPLKLYQLRKQYADDTQVNAQLDEAYQAIIDGNVVEAKTILDGILLEP